MVDKVVTSHFLMMDGRKVEVFMNEKGQYYKKDANGKIIMLGAKDVALV